MSAKLSRRSFLHSAALASGILLVDVRVPLRAADGSVAEVIAGWIRIDVDGNLTLLTNATEMGQGAQSGLAQILAEELDLDWSQVRVDFAPIDREHYGVWETYQTGGSGSIRGMFDRLRQAGAAARTMLLQAAAQRWKVPVDECVAHSGYVRHAQSSQSASYAALARDAARLPVPKDVPLKPRSEWQLIGKPMHRLDVLSKVTGTATYGIDVRRPGILYAAIAQSPVFKGSLESVDEAPAMKHRGVRRVLKLESAVVVVADSFWSAQKALTELKPVWRQSAMASVSSADISERLRALTRDPGKVYVNEGEDEAKIREQSDAQLTKARRVVERTYEAPLLSHSPMEPMNGTAFVRDGRAELWVPTQVQSELRTAVAKALGFDESAVTINTTELGGGFGRRLQVDYGVQAALIAREMGVPVKLIWTREEDTQHGFYRPAAAVRLRAALDDNNAITALRAQIGCLDGDTPVGGMAGQLYAIPNICISYAGWNPGVPLGAWRSVDASQNLFFFESFIDELAQELRQEPLAFRRNLLSDNARALRVLDAAAKLARWDEKLPKGHGRGIAFLRGYGSLAAQVAEVSVAANKQLRVHRVCCAVDCGTAVNPSSVRAQFEGGVIFGLSAAALGEITVANGRVQQSNFHDYPVVRMPQAPQIEVEILESPTEAVGGVGEPPVPPVAPAVANAIFAATGTRIRRLPLSASGFKLV
ncbi:MAG TPA: molybdopterin cofactor-binding domain-containing protein [Steroidobacteraceae bacterium]|nr:molybdopterin cofactor-binding domain-containing protein [Steroidobacteraceae bacterium]